MVIILCTIYWRDTSKLALEWNFPVKLAKARSGKGRRPRVVWEMIHFVGRVGKAACDVISTHEQRRVDCFCSMDGNPSRRSPPSPKKYTVFLPFTVYTACSQFMRRHYQIYKHIKTLQFNVALFAAINIIFDTLMVHKFTERHIQDFTSYSYIGISVRDRIGWIVSTSIRTKCIY